MNPADIGGQGGDATGDGTNDEVSAMDPATALNYLADSFEPLPEGQVSINADSTLFAQYASPTDRYGHGILGDAIEAGQLVVLKDATTYTHTLSEQHVFEDLRPRLTDVDGDGELELVTIRSSLRQGAGIVIYKIQDGALTNYAWVPEIGTSSRWLNIAAIHDLDGDGATELAWVQTPHIGGILRIARITPGEMTVLDEATLFSNHAIGQRNLCLSVVTRSEGAATLYVPAFDRAHIVGLQFRDNSLHTVETIDQQIDFSQSLASQHAFAGIFQGDDDCRLD